MYKQSPSRGHRSKGIKVKHILQVCLLVAVCFWLIYQVKHSHEKRKEFDAKDEKVVRKVQTDGEIRRLGRKDLPRVTEIAATDDEKHEEDDEDKELEEEEEDKHEKDEREREDIRVGEREEELDRSRGGGDDEADEDEPERTENLHEREEIDEVKERGENEEASEENHAENEENEGASEENHAETEENEGASEENHTENEENEGASEENRTENEENEGASEERSQNADVEDAKKDHSENEESEVVGNTDHTGPDENEDTFREDQNENSVRLDDQDHERGSSSTNTHEAREEQYKADDASSEVAHDSQTINPETRNVTVGHANEMFGSANFGQENETKISGKDETFVQSGVQSREEDVTKIGISANVRLSEQKKYETNLTKSGVGLLQNSTLPNLSIDRPENSSNSTAIVGEHSALLLSNGTQKAYDSNLSKNTTGEGTTADDVSNLQSNRLEANKSELAMDDKKQLEAAAGSNKTENVHTNTEESLSSSNMTSDISQKTNGTGAMAAKEDSSLHHDEKLNNSGTTGSDERSEYHSSEEGTDGAQHDPIDASDTSVTQEEKESRTDLDTLPEIRTEVQNTGDSVPE